MADPWTNDYYAAIVALAGITIVAKFVTHRSSGQGRAVKPQQEGVPHAGQPASDANQTKRTRRRFRLHVACVLLSFAAIGFSLFGLASGNEKLSFEFLCAILLGLALLIL